MTINRRRFIAAGAAGTAALAMGASGAFAQSAAQSATEAELYKAAQAEGELTWYIAHYASETAERIGQAFTAKYPGVRVNVVRTTAQVAYQRLNQDLQAQVANCDVFASTDLAHFADLKQRQLLMPYLPDNADEIDERFRSTDPDNAFVTTSGTFISILYNTDNVSEADAPKSWSDLVDERWRDRLSVGHPGFSGFVGAWVLQMQELYGWEYFEKMAEIDPQIGRSIIDTLTAVASGERDVAAGPGSLAQMQASRGNPIGVIYPEEGAVLMASPSAVMANAPHPNAAKLFIRFLWEPEVAAIAVDEYGTPLRTDATVREGVLPLGEMKTIRPTLDELIVGVPEVIENWRDTFGI